MERKQLDFNAPLLSVRRNSSSSASSDLSLKKSVKKPQPTRQQSLPSWKLDCELGEVTKPAAVPFLWERIPGKAKGEREAHNHILDEPSGTPSPRLPPGRLSGPIRKSCEQNLYRSQTEAYHFNDHASLIESLSKSLYTKGESDEDTEDDTFSDALDTLSASESLSLNCSLSGLSGYESRDVKASGNFTMDKQTREFMMSRFLPAAKAAILEIPQSTPKKTAEVIEPPKLLKKVVSGERKPLLKQYESKIISYYNQYPEDLESEDEDDNKYDTPAPGKKAGKARGFFPRLCVKNSLCLLNPLPGMKAKAAAPKVKSPTTASLVEVKRPIRKAYSGPLDKQVCEGIYKKRFHSGVLSRELLEVGKQPSTESNQVSFTSNSEKTDGVSPNRRFRSGRISPYRNEAPQSPFHEGARFLGLPKDIENVKVKKIDSFMKGCHSLLEVSSNRVNERKSGPPDNTVEKILYIDSASTVKIPIQDSDCSKTVGVVKSSEKDPKTLQNRPEHIAAEVHNQDAHCLKVFKEGSRTNSISTGLLDSVLPSAVYATDLRGLAQVIDGKKLDKNPEPQGMIKTDEHSMKSDDQKDDVAISLQSPLPPPLPKSPSESWLWRTLPSVSLRNPFSHSHAGRHVSPNKKQVQKTPAAASKWETIVKTSNLRHDHVRYSEELMPRISH